MIKVTSMNLRAGALTMSYDAGFLRYIRLGEHEVLRMIYHALRDHNWDTMRGSISDEKIIKKEDSFHINYKWISDEITFPFEWSVEIEGTSDSELYFSIIGSAGKDVMKNRTGFCILHPIEENLGKPCAIFTPNGEKVEGRFPTLISPHQPFLEITQMEWPVSELGTARLLFEGDIFEMEDQRNWCDNSFKTYCTPQRIPFPTQLKEGEKVSQKVSLKVAFKADSVTGIADELVTLSSSKKISNKPKIGVGASLGLQGLSPQELSAIGKLGLHHYRIEIDFSRPDWEVIWALRTEEAKQMNLGLELVLFFSTNYLREAAEVITRIEALPPGIDCSVLLLQKEHSSTPGALLDAICPLFRNSSRPLHLGAGTDEFFTELNRQRVATDKVDFVSYSQNPQCHAFDNETMIENLQANPYAVESARAYLNNLPVHVSPISFKPRSKQPGTTSIPEDADERQLQLFGAAWTMGVLLNLSKAGADSVTMYESSGYKGLMSGAQMIAVRDFQVQPYQTFPLYHVLGVFLYHQDSDWTAMQSSCPLTMDGIRFSSSGRKCLLISNYKNHSVQLQIPSLGVRYRMSTLEASTLYKIPDSDNYFMSNLGSIITSPGEFINCELPANAIAYFDFSEDGKK